MIRVPPTTLVQTLTDFADHMPEQIDALFNPSDYLVSPFNATDRFTEGKYFLTNQQEEIKAKICALQQKPQRPLFFSLEGGAGTGKTLLTYDIVRDSLAAGTRTLVIHCGALNDGHKALIRQGYTIIPAKQVSATDLSVFGLIVVDESQRIYRSDFDRILTSVQGSGGCCIFSHDGRQTLARDEASRAISGAIQGLPGVHKFKLTDKIRSNAGLANFIRQLLDHGRDLDIPDPAKISVTYFHDAVTADSYVDSLNGDPWTLLQLTPSRFTKDSHEDAYQARGTTSHKVIGQEFDDVAVIIDRHFSYDGKGRLSYSGRSYYDAERMLFQNLTRARQRLNIVIIDNPAVLRRCLRILTPGA